MIELGTKVIELCQCWSLKCLDNLEEIEYCTIVDFKNAERSSPNTKHWRILWYRGWLDISIYFSVPRGLAFNAIASNISTKWYRN